MKSLNDHFFSRKEFLDFFVHVLCGFFGEGEGEDLGWGDVFFFDHVCDLGGDGRGHACACENQLGGAWVCLIASSWRGFREEGRESNVMVPPF